MLEPSNPATASGELFRQISHTARQVEVQWSSGRAQGILRGVERYRRQQQRRRAMVMPMLAAASLVILLASVASWAAWSQHGSTWSWPWSSRYSTVIPQVAPEPEAPAPRRHRGESTPAMAPPPALPALIVPPIAPPPLPIPEERSDAGVPPPHGVAKPPQRLKSERPHLALAPPPVMPTSEASPAKPTWQQLAHDGQFEQAYTVVYGPPEAAGHVTPPAPAPLGAGDLLLLADVARLSHHPADAVTPLTQLLTNHTVDPRAPLAAFTLGRVLLDDLGRPREAADAFRRAQTLEHQGPDGPLAQDALAREVEAWSRAGEPLRARERAREYVGHYPKGRWLRSVRHYGELD